MELGRYDSFQDKIYQWICRQQEGGSRVATGDILNYLQVFSPLYLLYLFIYFCDILFDFFFENVQKSGIVHTHDKQNFTDSFFYF